LKFCLRVPRTLLTSVEDGNVEVEAGRSIVRVQRVILELCGTRENHRFRDLGVFLVAFVARLGAKKARVNAKSRFQSCKRVNEIEFRVTLVFKALQILHLSLQFGFVVDLFASEQEAQRSRSRHTRCAAGR